MTPEDRQEQTPQDPVEGPPDGPGEPGTDRESRHPPRAFGGPRPPSSTSPGLAGVGSRLPCPICPLRLQHVIRQLPCCARAPSPSPVFSSSWFSFLRFLQIYLAALTFRFQMLFNWYTEIPISFIFSLFSFAGFKKPGSLYTISPSSDC